MAAEHLRRLIERTCPGRSVRSLEEDAGVPPGRLGNLLKPGTAPARLPTLHRMQELAEIIGCEIGEVHQALRRDVDPGCLLEEGLSEDERTLLAKYRRLRTRERRHLIGVAEILHME